MDGIMSFSEGIVSEIYHLIQSHFYTFIILAVLTIFMLLLLKRIYKLAISEKIAEKHVTEYQVEISKLKQQKEEAEARADDIVASTVQGLKVFFSGGDGSESNCDRNFNFGLEAFDDDIGLTIAADIEQARRGALGAGDSEGLTAMIPSNNAKVIIEEVKKFLGSVIEFHGTEDGPQLFLRGLDLYGLKDKIESANRDAAVAKIKFIPVPIDFDESEAISIDVYPFELLQDAFKRRAKDERGWCVGVVTQEGEDPDIERKPMEILKDLAPYFLEERDEIIYLFHKSIDIESVRSYIDEEELLDLDENELKGVFSLE